MLGLDNFIAVQKELEATEMWFLESMLRISWTAKKSNEKPTQQDHS